MKLKTANVIAVLGFTLLGVALILAAMIGVLFIFPQISIFGAKSVNERDTEIIYADSALETAFTTGNFILESSTCKFVVRMSTAGYIGEGTIIVHESATGIAFNSLSRTLVEWTSTLVDDVPYLKIKVLEPNGIVFNQKPTIVYLNLNSQASLHNFILQNGYSDVSFEFGDQIEDTENQLHIDQLVVKSAAAVTIPSYKTMDINSVKILSNHTNFVCGANVNQDVLVDGYRGTQNFTAPIAGDVKVYGNQNAFRAYNAGNVDYLNENGSLALNDVKRLNVKTSMANITLRSASAGIKMSTVSGSLSASTISDGGLDFQSTGTGAVTISQALVGNVQVRHTGKGSTSLSGVAGNVDIESMEIDGGGIYVSYVGQKSYSTKIRGYDGNINVYNIFGATDIRVRDSGPSGAAGRANSNVTFNRITADDNWLVTGGYVGYTGIGNITVGLNEGWCSFDLYIYAATQARDYSSGHNGTMFTNRDDTPNEIDWGSDKIKGKLTVSTPSSFILR